MSQLSFQQTGIGSSKLFHQFLRVLLEYECLSTRIEEGDTFHNPFIRYHKCVVNSHVIFLSQNVTENSLISSFLFFQSTLLTNIIAIQSWDHFWHFKNGLWQFKNNLSIFRAALVSANNNNNSVGYMNSKTSIIRMKILLQRFDDNKFK